MATQAEYKGFPNTRRNSSNGALLSVVRKTHLYLGIFIAPALLFFSFTGAVQTLSLHESAGSAYTPPNWLARMGQLHKNQNILLRKPRPSVPDTAFKGPEKNASARDLGQGTGSPIAGPLLAPSVAPSKPPLTLAAKQRQHLPEKVFFVLVSLGLFLSTLTGIFMAYRYQRGKLLITALLLAGIVVPLLLLPF